MIYLNGRLGEGPEAGIDPTDRGLLLGDGLFETLLCRDGQALDFDAHFARLRRAAGRLRIPFDQSVQELSDGAADLLRALDLSEGDAALRITLTRGSGPRGLLPPQDPRPTLIMSAQTAPSRVPGPAKLIIAGLRRNEHSPCANLKTLGYLDNVLARQEAEERGADEALLLNTAGRLCCGSASNIFLIEGQGLVTPPLSDGVLPGITRAKVLAQAGHLRLTCVERSLGPEDIAAARGGFLTNSLMGARPIAAIESTAYDLDDTRGLLEKLAPALSGATS